RERERLLGEIEDGAALLDVLRRSSTEAILVFAMRYQPLGRDFKWVHSLLGVVYDMFRIGRYCREIALADRYVSRLSEESLRDLKEVVELAIEAYENAYRAFFEGCVSCVDRVKEIDSRVDSLYMGLLKEVGSAGVVPSTTVAKVLVLRHIERVVDHIVNIALSN
ncbi:MAG: phosphate uptake regulator PhoU, partial [Desulfurococcaceae archaeon]|nr:phosphate uptake regulator PhoU [Desulfurococcaceae archaeon]